MSEEDYNRGRRGGEAKVSISDWERWKDWKAGHDEWEKEQDDEDLARVLEAGDQDLINKEFQRRELERQRQEKYIQESHEKYLEREKRRKQDTGLCWVATAYYGSPRHPKVVQLKELRRSWLNGTLTRPMMFTMNTLYQAVGRTTFGVWWARGVAVPASWNFRRWLSRCILSMLLRVSEFNKAKT